MQRTRRQSPIRSVDVCDKLKEEILSGTFRPGDKLEEAHLADRYRSSRTPVREAIRKLAEKGLVELVPRSGAFVRRIQFREALDLNLLRETLEGLAGRLAANRMSVEEIESLKATMAPFSLETIGEDGAAYIDANRRFHRIILLGSQHTGLISMLENVHDQLKLANFLALKSKDRMRNSLLEHMEIIKAIDQRDSVLAEDLLRRHVANVRDHLIQDIQRDGERYSS